MVFLDQFTKYIIINNMTLYDSIPVINNIFEIHYIQNPGAAWGILANHQLLFIICT
ncbi:MAG: signal peptidase II, partial [Lachnospiraceae bacterium]|nr:signal peptidase II [Lachnospiraceae bacterium]